MGKKYELVKEESMRVDEIYTVYRVKALRNFSDVHAGDVGGWVEYGKEANRAYTRA